MTTTVDAARFGANPGVTVDAGANPPSKPLDATTELEVSRARLRLALLGNTGLPVTAPLPRSSAGVPIGKPVRRPSVPAASAIVDGARAWWRKSPASKVARLTAPGATAVASSLARRNPQALWLISAGAGALAVVAPWRRMGLWLFRPALLFGLLFEIVKASRRSPDPTR